MAKGEARATNSCYLALRNNPSLHEFCEDVGSGEHNPLLEDQFCLHITLRKGRSNSGKDVLKQNIFSTLFLSFLSRGTSWDRTEQAVKVTSLVVARF